MLSKAYLNHYDTAILVGGDDDFLDIVQAVKNNTGKKVVGAYFQHNVSSALADNVDTGFVLNEDLELRKFKRK